jgi:mono/diheme cytochrome c family protein
MMELNWRIQIGIGVVALFLVSALYFPARPNTGAESTYKAKCAPCHGPDGSGDTAVGKKLGVHDFHSAEVQKMSDSELTEITSKGKNKMPDYEKSLKPDDIKELVNYIRTFAAKK